MNGYNRAALATFRNNGGTFTLSGDAVHQSQGYYVGGFLSTITVPTRETSTGKLAATLQDVACVISDGKCGDGTFYLGTWVDQGIVYIDASKWCDDVDTALRVARYNGEIAIWDIANASAIELTPARD